MALIVKKFGGSSVATPEKMFGIVERVLSEKQEDDQIVIVVSAMGDTTDDLLDLAKKITHRPYGREMDMLLSTGEQMSIALMAMAFEERGQKAISMTGFQAGISSSDAHGKGQILSIDPKRVVKALREGYIVVVAGFQGITEEGDITTLGRGGSDTTAVALAGAMQADVCEIFTDVEGVYSTDPRVVPQAVKLPEITYGEMLELARLGAGVIQPRAVEMGSRFKVPIHVRSTFSKNEGTIIREEYQMEGNKRSVTGIAHDFNTAKIGLLGVENKPGFAYKVFKALADKNVVVDMIVQSVHEANRDQIDVMFTTTKEDAVLAEAVIAELRESLHIREVVVDMNMAKVSVVGAGMLGTPGVAAKMFGVMAKEGINIESISTSEISITCLINRDSAERAVAAIHKEIFGE